ncbi:MAG: GAF domain-containing protein [Sulfuritalea sp.]|nr:GAF domain-containing protein [Sulfuritalea sp.]MDP1984562.1 GAF domain-containing protein [Sulfuritalea sp.]
MTLPATTQTQHSQLETMQDRLDFAKKLQALTNKIHATDNISQIMLDLAPEICELFECERLTLYVVNKEQGALVSKVKTGIDSDKELVLPINRQSIAGYVALTRGTVRINNLDDPAELRAIDPELRFFENIDRATGFKSKQMLVAPLLQGISKELVGVLQLINQQDEGRFDSIAEGGLEALSATLALAFFQRIKTGALVPKRYEALASQGVISAPELELAQRWAQRKNKDLEQVLVEDFQVPLAAIGRALAKQAKLEYQACGSDWKPDPELVKRLNRATCLQYQWLPCSRDRNLLVVVTTDPGNRIGSDNLQRSFPYDKIVLHYTTRTEFNQMLEKYFPAAK